MSVSDYRVSERGQMALPASARRRWAMMDGGTVEIADLGHALLVVPAGTSLRSMLQQSIDEAGGYHALVDSVADDDSELR